MRLFLDRVADLYREETFQSISALNLVSRGAGDQDVDTDST